MRVNAQFCFKKLSGITVVSENLRRKSDFNWCWFLLSFGKCLCLSSSLFLLTKGIRFVSWFIYSSFGSRVDEPGNTIDWVYGKADILGFFDCVIVVVDADDDKVVVLIVA